MWILEKTLKFEKKFNSIIPAQYRPQLERRIEKAVSNNPLNAGKPLGCSFFRELKLGKWRIYYLAYRKFLVVFFIDISDKSGQNCAIREIRNYLKDYEKVIASKYSK